MQDLGTLIARLGADITDLKRGLAEGRQQLASFQGMAQRAGVSIRRALSFVGVGAAVYLTLRKIKEGFETAFHAADEFQVTTIGIAAALTNLAKDTAEPGLAFAQNLEFAKEMYAALEEEAAKHFGTAQDLQQAFNILIQKGVIARKEDVQALGLLVDQIKLLTQGQNQNLQIAQELRALADGQAKATSALAMMVKDRLGKEWAKILAQHREAGDWLQFLASLFPGLQAALEKIKNTYEAQKNTLISKLKLIGREGLAGAYDDITQFLKEINTYLEEHKDELIAGIRDAWRDTKEILVGIKVALEGIYDVLKAIKNIMPDIVGWAKALSRALQWDEANYQMLKALARGDLAAARAAALKRAQVEGLPLEGRGWTPEDILAGRVKVTIPPPSGMPEIDTRKEQDKKKAAKRYEDLLKIFNEYLDAKRNLEIKAAEDSLKTLKQSLELERAELEKGLEGCLITGQEYYARLKELAQRESEATLQVLQKKLQLEKEAYQAARAEVEQRLKAKETSPEAAELMLKKLATQHQMRLNELEAQSLQNKIELQKKLVDLLREEADNRREVEDILWRSQLETALGPLAEKEAELNDFLRERLRLRQELEQLGAAPEEISIFDRFTQELFLKAKYGEYITQWASTFTARLHETLSEQLFGEGSKKKLSEILTDLGRMIGQMLLKETLLPLEQALTRLFRWLFRWLEQAFGSMFGMPVMGFAQGGIGFGATGGLNLKAFQHGGIIARPTLFRLTSGLGLAGEAGAEAILPLTKIGDDLGVKAIVPGSPKVTVINNTGVTAKSEVSMSDDGELQIVLEREITGMLARGGPLLNTLLNVLDVRRRV